MTEEDPATGEAYHAESNAAKNRLQGVFEMNDGR